ncbi:MAG: DUF3341 domain-containing protein [Elusimicrobia bacterium]|nr:DUF3341 domain-containing protein [Elusimicrobiota bacterium]
MSRAVLISFANEQDALRAALRLKSGGYRVLDAHVPYPVHGLDRALGLPPSRLPVLCFFLGTAGAFSAFFFQTWVSTIDWPVRIGGKPFYAWPSFIPIAFELTVLVAGLGTVGALLLSRGLLPWRQARADLAGTSDARFVLVVQEDTPGYDRHELWGLCRDCGALRLDAREEEG